MMYFTVIVLFCDILCNTILRLLYYKMTAFLRYTLLLTTNYTRHYTLTKTVLYVYLVFLFLFYFGIVPIGHGLQFSLTRDQVSKFSSSKYLRFIKIFLDSWIFDVFVFCFLM